MRAVAARSPTRNLGNTHLPMRDAVAAELRNLILSGRAGIGMHLIEEHLAEEFGVSRNTVREAIRILASEGFVETVPRKGAFVSRHSLEEASDIFDLRLALEPLGARLAARRSAGDDITALRNLIDRAKLATSARSLDLLADLNTEFHTRVVEVAGNEYLTNATVPMIKRGQWLVRQSVDSRAPHSWTEHRDLLDAIEAHDEQLAESLAHGHVIAARRHLQTHESEMVTKRSKGTRSQR